MDPPSGRIWTANARVVAGDKLDARGRRRLRPRRAPAPDPRRPPGARQGRARRTCCEVQLDDRALFLARWQKLLLELLTPEAVAKRRAARRGAPPRRARGAGAPPPARSATGSCAQFRVQAARDALPPLVAACAAADPRFDYLGRRPNQGSRQWEGPLWALVTERPAHLLDPRYARWEDLLLALARRGARRADAGRRAARAAHLGRAQHHADPAPALARRAAPRALARHAARAAARRREHAARPGPVERRLRAARASRRGARSRATSTCRRARAATRSRRTTRDGHAAWAKGEPTPFLPGPAVHVLTLVPGP